MRHAENISISQSHPWNNFAIICKKLLMIRSAAREATRPSNAKSVAAELTPFSAPASLKTALATLKLTPRWSVRDERFTHVARSLLLIGYSGRHLKTHLVVSSKLCSSSPQISTPRRKIWTIRCRRFQGHRWDVELISRFPR
jgi:hypothetical protein